MGVGCKTRFNLYPLITMTYQEYNDKRDDMVNAYNNGEMNLPDLQYGLAKLNREYERQAEEDYEALQRKIAKDRENKLSELESSRPASTFDNWTERAEEATRKMKERMHEIRTKWAHAYIYGDKVKIKKGQYGLPLVEMSVLEARLLANEILSITNKQRRKQK